MVVTWGIGVKVGGPGRRAVEEGIRKVMVDGGEMERRVIELKDRIMGEEGDSRAVATIMAFVDGLKTISLGAGDCLFSCVSSLSVCVDQELKKVAHVCKIQPLVGWVPPQACSDPKFMLAHLLVGPDLCGIMDHWTFSF